MVNERLADLARDTPETPPGVRLVSGGVLADLGLGLGLGAREMELAALAAGLVPARYLRNMRTYGPAAQARFLRSRVALAGLGGLGGHLLELLARAGVGALAAADGDVFEESNLNRQTLCLADGLGQAKAEAARLRASAVNPAMDCVVRAGFLDQQGFSELVQGADLVLDALGGVAPRLLLRRAAAQAGVPLLTAAVAGTSGYVALVRPGDPSPTDYFGTGADEAKPPAEVLLGTPPPTVALAAALQAAQALAFLSDQGSTEGSGLAGKMLLFDLADMTFATVSL